MKTLAAILHYNTPQYTDVLYELLESEQQSGNYDLAVVDNGSDEGKRSKYTTYQLDENIFFGGGLNAAMNLVLESDEYDSLLFLNSDLIVGKNFVSSLRQNTSTYDVISPCIIQPEKTQNYWKQMLPWGTEKIRDVRWIDLQCPMISKHFIKYVFDKEGQIDPLLLRGWGIDVWFGIACEKQGWTTGVVDHTVAVHLGSMTMKALGNTNEYCRLAEQDMYEFFNKKGLMNEFIDMRKWGESYKHE